MKQGRASHSGSGATKPGTIINKVNPAAVSRMGIMQGNHGDRGTVNTQSVPLYHGRGVEAPTKKVTTYPKGSQR